MPLSLANAGQELQVLTINSSHENRMRLVNLGITSGISIRVINRNPSALLVGVRETRIMLDLRLAHQIYVQ
ncbi:MAG TPA: FeoA family protein [Negativicutes bacterium]|jgi:Fe2+ transport system protein FeoA